MFSNLGLKSFAHYLHADFENIYQAQQDPTLVQHTLFAKSLEKFISEMKDPFQPKKLMIFIRMWINSKKLEKLIVQVFTHLQSNPQTEVIANTLYHSLVRNNTFNRIQNKRGNLDYAVQSIEAMIKASKQQNAVPNNNRAITNNYYTINNHYSSTQNNYTTENTYVTINQSLSQQITVISNYEIIIIEVLSDESYEQTCRFAVFPYIHKNTENLIKLGRFLEEHGYIENRRSFISLFLPTKDDSDKVIWLKELNDLCFLIKALILFRVISEKEQNTWAAKTERHFVSISVRKKNPGIKADTLNSTSTKLKLPSLSLANIEEWMKSHGTPSIHLLYQEFQRLYGQ